MVFLNVTSDKIAMLHFRCGCKEDAGVCTQTPETSPPFFRLTQVSSVVQLLRLLVLFGTTFGSDARMLSCDARVEVGVLGLSCCYGRGVSHWVAEHGVEALGIRHVLHSPHLVSGIHVREHSCGRNTGTSWKGIPLVLRQTRAAEQAIISSATTESTAQIFRFLHEVTGGTAIIFHWGGGGVANIFLVFKTFVKIGKIKVSN
jgi:hypothetical protein